MDSKEILHDLFQDIGAIPKREHVLYVRDFDGSVVEWDTAQDIPGLKESLQRKASTMGVPAWVQTREISNAG